MKKRTASQAQAHRAQLVSDLKEKLEYNYARGVLKDGALCTTMLAAAWPRGTGIQPKILGQAAAGNVYALTNGQVRKFLAKMGETPPPKEMKK